MPNIDNVEQDRWDTVTNTTNGKGGESETMTNQIRIECQRTMSVMPELEMMKWQIYFSHLTERTNWMIHVMTKRRKK